MFFKLKNKNILKKHLKKGMHTLLNQSIVSHTCLLKPLFNSSSNNIGNLMGTHWELEGNMLLRTKEFFSWLINSLRKKIFSQNFSKSKIYYLFLLIKL
jgi:hypothetical protein